MAVSVSIGVSRSGDAIEAFTSAAADAEAGLDGPCDLCVVFASGDHLARADDAVEAVSARLRPAHLIGCGAGGVVGGGHEFETGTTALVWAASLPGAEVATHHLEAETDEQGSVVVSGLPDGENRPDCLILLADPHSFPTDPVLEHLNEECPGCPVLGGLASAGLGDAGVVFHGEEALQGGAVAAALKGVTVVPCVSQGAAPVGPEMTITAADGNLIRELASKPAVERLSEALASLPDRERELAQRGVMLGIVIDENKPDYERGDFLVRPIIGADQSANAVAVGDTVRVGQTVRLHVRDAASADEDLREALRARDAAIGDGRAAGVLLFTCNGRGTNMFEVPDHDVSAVSDALAVPVGGFFCAGEIGPVGGRNFLHGFTATMALFVDG